MECTRKRTQDWLRATESLVVSVMLEIDAGDDERQPDSNSSELFSSELMERLREETQYSPVKGGESVDVAFHMACESAWRSTNTAPSARQVSAPRSHRSDPDNISLPDSLDDDDVVPPRPYNGPTNVQRKQDYNQGGQKGSKRPGKGRGKARKGKVGGQMSKKYSLPLEELQAPLPYVAYPLQRQPVYLGNIGQSYLAPRTINIGRSTGTGVAGTGVFQPMYKAAAH